MEKNLEPDRNQAIKILNQTSNCIDCYYTNSAFIGCVKIYFKNSVHPD